MTAAHQIKMPEHLAGALQAGRYVFRRPLEGANNPDCWVELERAIPLIEPFGSGPSVIRDVEPHRSMMSGKMIGSRKQLRDELRAYRCIDIGNEQVKSKRPSPDRMGVRAALKQAKEAMAIHGGTRINARG